MKTMAFGLSAGVAMFAGIIGYITYQFTLFLDWIASILSILN